MGSRPLTVQSKAVLVSNHEAVRELEILRNWRKMMDQVQYEVEGDVKQKQNILDKNLSSEIEKLGG